MIGEFFFAFKVKFHLCLIYDVDALKKFCLHQQDDNNFIWLSSLTYSDYKTQGVVILGDVTVLLEIIK